MADAEDEVVLDGIPKYHIQCSYIIWKPFYQRKHQRVLPRLQNVAFGLASISRVYFWSELHLAGSIWTPFYKYLSNTWTSIAGLANQSETKSHVSYCFMARGHIIHMGTHEQHLISSSLTHLPSLS